MPNTFPASVIAGHRMSDGAPLFLTDTDRWTRHLPDAEVIEDEAHADIRLLEAGYRAGALRNVQLVAVETRSRGAPRLLHDAVIS